LEEARILSIDYGETRIGLAITDPLNMFAYPLTTINNDTLLWQNLTRIFNEYKVVKVIIGYPLKESGAVSRISESILKLKKEIEIKFNLVAELVDERYSSQIAQQRIINSVQSRKKRKDKSLIDKNAAAVLLEDYLKKVKR